MKSVFSALLSASVLLSAASAAQAETTTAKLLDRSAHLIAAGNWRQVVAVNHALLAHPDLTAETRVAAYANLCVAESKQNHLVQAEDACDKSIELNADYWANYVNRGNVRTMIGDVRGARSDYARAKALNPTLQPQPTFGALTADFVALASSPVAAQEAAVP